MKINSLFFYVIAVFFLLILLPAKLSMAQTDGVTKQISVPLEPHLWQNLKYDSLPAHNIRFVSGKIKISVNNSASPLIYPMSHNPPSITGISIKGWVNRLVQIAPPHQQGQKGLDDFNLRVGLVLLGSTRLKWVQRQVAPDWIIKMFNLAPKNQGISHIYFLNATLSPALLNKKRIHPLSEYIKEENAWLMDKPGAFSYSKNFRTAKETGALWISVDGDDTNSRFQINIEEITLNVTKK